MNAEAHDLYGWIIKILRDVFHSISMGQVRNGVKQQGGWAALWQSGGVVDVAMREHVATVTECLSEPPSPWFYMLNV